MNAGKMIDEMARQGFECHVGPHKGISGYFAFFACPLTAPKCETCGETIIAWNDCGHGYTPQQAIRNARTIALGQTTTQMRPEDFR